MLWISLLIIVVVTVLIISRRSQPNVVVLGQQIAQAETNEAARLASGPIGPSPMPKYQYDAENGDYSLVSVICLPLDTELQKLTKEFRSWEEIQRRGAQDAINIDELYTLIHFSKRSAVMAMQEHSVARCVDGLTALSMIDEKRIDPRDAAWAAGLLSHAIEVTGAERQQLLEQIKTLARPDMAKLLSGISTPAKLSDWGYAEILVDGRPGLIRASFASYQPTFDMGKLSLKVAAMLQKGKYIADPEIAVEIPAVWFAHEHSAAAEKLLKNSRAGIVVRGDLREKHSTNARAQMLLCWVVECKTEEDARTLLGYVGDGTSASGRFSVGTASGRLFAILVGGSSTVGVEPFESRESLGLLANETQTLLVEANAAPRAEHP